MTAHGDAVDTTGKRVDETADREHDGIERAARVILESHADRIARNPMVAPVSMQAARQYARALHAAGLVAPAPLHEEWTTADAEGDAHTCCGYEDEKVVRADAARCRYGVAHRWVTDWQAEGDGR